MSETIQSVEKIAKPREVKVALRILWIFLIISIVVGAVYMIFSLDDLIAKALKEVSDENAKQFAKMFVIAIAVFSMAFALVINALLYVMVSKGHNWARIILVVFFAISIPFWAISVLHLLGILAPPQVSAMNFNMQIANVIANFLRLVATSYALILLFSKPANAWFSTARR